MSDNEQNQEMQIQMSPDVQRGAYSNQMMVTHTQEEFVLDFILATPPLGTVTSRVLVSPTHAKRILAALNENIMNYEKVFGTIEPIQSTQPAQSTTRH